MIKILIVCRECSFKDEEHCIEGARGTAIEHYKGTGHNVMVMPYGVEYFNSSNLRTLLEEL